ncbi:MAG: TerC family protein [Candidatus Marinimicrobia bacterium]|nr:TerC family protein [Candidatus Neomarinimicrobiota bacterium]MCF7829319.1 TerC family protein [Candidatus Neomarinimicrobiota bacterium]MCF7880019.1 TerC family protein [Candidatus Neomarinimicrobiota bacterium]
MPNDTLLWIGFNIFVLIMLAIDLGVFNREAHKITVRESLIWTAVWIGLALLFNAGIWYYSGTDKALEFLSGYLIEKSLSMDNLFVFLVIFTYFKVSKEFQHKVLFWGIIGALVFRALFIFAGVALINKFHWLIYVLGIFLLYTGFKMAFQSDHDVDVEKNPMLNLVRKIFPVTGQYRGDRFFIKEQGKLFATPLFIVLVMIETTDVMFAVDSIPAILAISRDPFIVYSSNVFAILGLRALFFALAGIMELFEYLHYGLAAILGFVGMKMLLSEWVHLPVWLALTVIAIILTVTITTSVYHGKKQSPESA